MLIGRCQRSNDVIEPRLKTQWFIRTGPLAERALDATRSGRTRILPERFEKVWEHWLTNIRDWNVSRQLWWGHRIPAWYCPDGHVTVTAEATGPSACEVCGRPASELVQDPDIFDTWFSSGLWPFSTLGWPDPTDDFRRYYPTSVMETGHDILFFWVARMMMLGIHLTGREPFHTVYLSGLIRDAQGQRMSKTKGNVVDPLAVMEESGADALRFALIHGATPGLDQRFGEQKLESARNFANKLWNATRYVLGARPASIAADATRADPDAAASARSDRWIRSRTAAAVTEVDRAIADYTFAEVTRALYDGIWSEFCDWGLELAKVRLSDATLPAEEREATWWTLVEALDTFLRLLHPVMPFVTEVLWAALPHRGDESPLLITARAGPPPARATRPWNPDVSEVLDLIRAIRNARAEAGVDAAAWLPGMAIVPEDGRGWGPAPTRGAGGVRGVFEALRPAIERLARVRPLTVTGSAGQPVKSALSALAGRLQVVLELGGDGGAGGTAQDRGRLERELADAKEPPRGRPRTPREPAVRRARARGHHRGCGRVRRS